MKRAVIVYLMFFLITPIVIKAEKKPWRAGIRNHPEYDSNLYWEFNSGVLTISGDGPMPSSGVPWASVNGGHGKDAIEKIIIKEGVTTIREMLFWKAKRLNTVVIESSVTSIGVGAFEDCVNLKSINLPNSLTSIEARTFYGCKSLSSISIPNTIISIGALAFSGCSSLTSVSLPSSLVSMGTDAFNGCRGITSIKIPQSLTSIPNGAFANCVSLKTVEIPKTMRAIGDGAFADCALSSVIIPSLTATIANSAFTKYCSGGVIAIAKTFTVKNIGYAIVTEESTVKTGSNSVSTTINHGLRDAKGNWIIPLGTYSEITPLTDIFIKVKRRNLFGLITVNGKEILPTEMEALESAGTGYLKYKINGFWGVMNYAGKIIIDTDRGYTSIGNFVTFTKRFPYTMAGYKGECDATGRQISKIKVETPKQNTSVASSSSSSSSSNSSSINNNSGNKTTTVVVEHHRDPVPVQEWHACLACGGMGTMGCDNCGGSGTKYIGDRLHRCSRCNGRGIIPCNVCYGNKGQYTTVYR